MNKQILKAISNLEKRVVDLYNKLKVIPKPTYKVYTALLTQSGEYNIQFLTGSGSLVIGVTYMIEDDGGTGWDFTNVGAPNNLLGTYFVATGTTPANWGNSGMLTYNTGAPVVTVLENTIGNVWFAYNDFGSCIIISNDLFTLNKTIGFITFNDCCASGIGDKPFLTINYIYVSSALNGVSTDNVIQNTSIEIRVYN
jgi:hypothetical protein